MQLTVLGSNSSGNGYVLQNESEAIILECGCPLSDCLKALKFNTRKVAGVLTTHIHGDHFAYYQQYRERFTLYMSRGTLNALALSNDYHLTPLEPLKTANIGNFKVMPFPVEHDAPEPFGYLIQHPDFGTLIFATDTYYIKYKFPNIDWMMIECNYIERILDENVKNGSVPAVVRSRVLKSHLSLRRCVDCIKANNHNNLKGVILLHLSPNNSNKKEMKEEVEKSCGKQVFIAEKNTSIFLI